MGIGSRHGAPGRYREECRLGYPTDAQGTIFGWGSRLIIGYVLLAVTSSHEAEGGSCSGMLY